MAQLLPTINVASAREFEQRANMVRYWRVPSVQVDVSDGIIGIPKNLNDPALAARVLAGIRVEVHLMVEDVEWAIETWRTVRPTRIFIHREAREDPQPVLASLAAAGIGSGLALGPETPVERVEPLLAQCDMLLFVSVPPGRSGQGLDPQTPARVAAVRHMHPQLAIGVDGGVKPHTVAALVAAGATHLYAASAIFNVLDPRAAYDELRRLAEASPGPA